VENAFARFLAILDELPAIPEMSKAERLVLEDAWAEFLTACVDYGNDAFLSNFSLELKDGGDLITQSQEWRELYHDS
jgi:hypothetical protein